MKREITAHLEIQYSELNFAWGVVFRFTIPSEGEHIVPIRLGFETKGEAIDYVNRIAPRKRVKNSLGQVYDTKHDNSCLEKAGDDEPIFVLRGQDITAPQVVAFWIGLNVNNNNIMGSPKLAQAFNTLIAMREMTGRKHPD